MTATTNEKPQENTKPTWKQKLLGGIHHMAKGVPENRARIVFVGVSSGIAAGIGSVPVLTAALSTGITCIIGGIFASVVEVSTNRYRDCVSHLKQARLNKIGGVALVGASLAVGGITGLYAYNEKTAELRTQAPAQPSRPKASNFSVTQDGAGDCTVVFNRNANPKVISGNCAVTQEATKTPTSGGASLTPAQ